MSAGLPCAAGVITWRPIEGDSTQVQLVIQRLRALSRTGAVRDLHQLFVDCARAVPGTGTAAAHGPATGRPRDGTSPGALAAPRG